LIQVSPHHAQVRLVGDRHPCDPILPVFHLRPRRSIIIETQRDLRVIAIVSVIDQTNDANIEVRNETSDTVILSEEAEVRSLRDFLLTSYTDCPSTDTFPPKQLTTARLPDYELKQTAAACYISTSRRMTLMDYRSSRSPCAEQHPSPLLEASSKAMSMVSSCDQLLERRKRIQRG
jgi:hypothetical protein